MPPRGCRHRPGDDQARTTRSDLRTRGRTRRRGRQHLWLRLAVRLLFFDDMAPAASCTINHDSGLSQVACERSQVPSSGAPPSIERPGLATSLGGVRSTPASLAEPAQVATALDCHVSGDAKAGLYCGLEATLLQPGRWLARASCCSRRCTRSRPRQCRRPDADLRLDAITTSAGTERGWRARRYRLQHGMDGALRLSTEFPPWTTPTARAASGPGLLGGELGACSLQAEGRGWQTQERASRARHSLSVGGARATPPRWLSFTRR